MRVDERSAGWHVAVLIPARNEELLLPECLRSVERARRALPAEVTTDVVVISDGSTDGTAECAQAVLGERGAVRLANVQCVGAARALAAAVALGRFHGELSRCWLANTDADCAVPETWLVDQLRLARTGAMSVAGIVDVLDFSEHMPEVEQRFRGSYRIDADGRHPHVHGANLGVRADAYVLAGGWSDLATAEDHDLWARLRKVEAVQLSDARLSVVTSGRRVGRAPAGFAQALAQHNEPLVAL